MQVIADTDLHTYKISLHCFADLRTISKHSLTHCSEYFLLLRTNFCRFHVDHKDYNNDNIDYHDIIKIFKDYNVQINEQNSYIKDKLTTQNLMMPLTIWNQ